MSLRKMLFWTHLVTGLLAGLLIAVMSFTGAALAFEKELVAWAERDLRRVTAPPGAPSRLSMDVLLQRLRAEHPGLKVSAITVEADPTAAVAFSAGREGTVYADPYTGALRKPTTRRMAAFMDTMTDWHRWLALKDGARPIGKIVNGTANLVFLSLCITGLALWWPRNWTRRGLKALLVVNLRLKGRARDWNWHNALGLWTLPVLVVLTATAVPISFQWGNALVYRLAGEAPGVPQAPASLPPLTPPNPGQAPVPWGVILESQAARHAGWVSLTLRNGAPRRGAPEPRGPQPLQLSVKRPDAWPRTAATALLLHPYTGETLQTTRWEDQSLGRRIRIWTRFLHTGEALGWLGQLLAGIASLGALVLIYTGFALSWRRFFPKKRHAA